MLVVDASVLFEVVSDSPVSEEMRARLADDPDHAAPHIVDAEVLGVIRRYHLDGRLDRTAASQAIGDLGDWPGERFGHQPMLERAWSLRESVRSWDVVYVALAEALDAVLVTTDRRLAGATGPRCVIEVL